ncbi:MAG: hypothetical protein WD598_06810 [Acidimicrobiia bacterium]
MTAEDRVWSAETQRVRGTDAFGPLWRAVVLRGSGRSSSGPARQLADALRSLGTEVEVLDGGAPRAIGGGVDLVCACEPRLPFAAERLAFDFDAPFLSLATIPDRDHLAQLIEHLRMRREPALEWRANDELDFAVSRLEVEGRDDLTIDLDPNALAAKTHHGHRAVIQPASRGLGSPSRSTLQITTDPAGHPAQASSLRVQGRDLVIAVDGIHVVTANREFHVRVHPRSRLVCC